MRSPNFFSELKRRNVYKVAVAYIVAGWALAQASAGAPHIGQVSKDSVWVPTPEHLAEHPEVAKWIHGMPGGKNNPMGARALYLYQGDVDTVIRIHGAVKPSLIGKKTTAGCISLLNIDVIHLYDRVELGAKVVILPPDA